MLLMSLSVMTITTFKIDEEIKRAWYHLSLRLLNRLNQLPSVNGN